VSIVFFHSLRHFGLYSYKPTANYNTAVIHLYIATLPKNMDSRAAARPCIFFNVTTQNRKRSTTRHTKCSRKCKTLSGVFKTGIYAQWLRIKGIAVTSGSSRTEFCENSDATAPSTHRLTTAAQGYFAPLYRDHMHNLFSGVDSMLAVTQSQFSASGVTFCPEGDEVRVTKCPTLAGPSV